MGARHASLATIVLSLIVRLAFDEVACSLGRRTVGDALARTLTLEFVRVADPTGARSVASPLGESSTLTSRGRRTELCHSGRSAWQNSGETSQIAEICRRPRSDTGSLNSL
jgi:hypothetical protein